MAKYVLDTNVLIDALNLPAQLEALLGFLHWALPTTYLSAIVVYELAAGTTTPRQRALLEQQVAGPFVRRGRVFAPSVGAWQRAGRLFAGGHRVSTPAGLNDLLLAVSSREAGLTIVSNDRGVRRLTGIVSGLSVVPPFPTPPSKGGA
ncbi:MAG: type II toxin-antitoxin system VapC family toxin [Armatimonadota bacterium]